MNRVVRGSRFVTRTSLLLRFSLLALSILLLIGAGLGWILQRQMEQTALRQQADEVAVVIDGTISRNVIGADLQTATHPQARQLWVSLAQRLIRADSHLVRIKVWNRSGTVVYSNDSRQIGKRFPLDADLRAALEGRQSMDVSNLTKNENVGDRRGYSSLLETYIPLRSSGRVVGAYEAYSDLTALNAELRDSRRILWMSVAGGFLLLYAALFAIVRQASRRLVKQVSAISKLEVHAREAESLRQVDRLKDEFIGTVSHELRRPLASIKGYTASLLLPDAQWTPEIQREFLQVIDEEADTLSQQIDNLLDLARLGSGSLPLDCEPVHLPALCQQAVHRIQAQPQLRDHLYRLDFPEGFPYVEADQNRLFQVFLNLLENAAKYSPAHSLISVKGMVEPGAVTVSITDQGIGLTGDEASHVFEKFFRVDSGLARATEGTGLGLAICRGVMMAHNGTITVESTRNEGSTFTVRLPLPESTVEIPAPRSTIHAGRE
jgi:signal transduction histidine kinase